MSFWEDKLCVVMKRQAIRQAANSTAGIKMLPLASSNAQWARSNVKIEIILKEVLLYFWGFCVSFILLSSIFVRVKGLQSEKAQSPPRRKLLSPIENTSPALHETPCLESSLYFCNLCASSLCACNRCCINTYTYVCVCVCVCVCVSWNIYTPASQTYSCNCCSGIILDHTTLHGMTCPTLPLIGCILLNWQDVANKKLNM